MKKFIFSGLLLCLGNAHAIEDLKISNTVTLKNLYAERDYSESDADLGSWTQGLIYRGKFSYKLNQDWNVALNPSFQYAYRLSNDKGLADTILPFDPIAQEQKQHQHKQGINFEASFQNHTLSYGEQWINNPMLVVDPSRQLLPSFHGAVYTGKFKDTTVSAGLIDKYSRRSAEHFKKISVKNIESDGLTYLDIQHAISPNLKLHVFNGYLENLYNQSMLGLDYKWQFLDTKMQTNFRYFNNTDIGDAKLGSVDSNNIGIINYAEVLPKLKVGIGYQKIFGDNDYPLIDGPIPVLDFINWTQGSFIKKDEESYHLTLSYDFDALIPGLKLDTKYIRGENFKTQGKDDNETEFNYRFGYTINDGLFQGLSFSWLNIDYKSKYGRDYNENRVYTMYTFKF